ncbi:relaxase/mobilization nuclease domain-containing protein [Cryobacterium psychrophilum]|uniref:MobA/VirD2-like nuclease domain-containing protein n=1 Tax=Cryobacterium psychrophilum TaxID=41988 RepID=A0A4Y8KTS8_9MICO|nr:relaxase/mobilization nuclease domain-containing protein [Cryobacterium psychrophilum]TDW31408.1 hypothetical protein EDD25_3221 [Cryobacterium psychrophilum]TFD78850.1 hypothetical protein E3T53_08665 [Cryobacterium psychrophilum]
MSVTDVKPDYDLGTSADYLVFGVGAKKRKHTAAGSNRIVPGFYCDAPCVEAFVALGDELAKQNSRKVKAQSYVLSFSPEEFDVDSPADLQRVGDAGFLLAKKMHPNSACLVVVHADGKGRAAHAHIKVLNHDTATGMALRDFRVHWRVKKANDELMRDLGMQVVEAKPKQPTDAWVTRRNELPQYEQQLGDVCAEAKFEALAATLAAPSPSMARFTARFTAACQARGVELVTDEYKVKSGNRGGKQEGATVVGFTFKMRDDTTPKRRIRRRKASALSSEFTHDAITAAFDAKQMQPQEGVPAQVPVRRQPKRPRMAQQKTAATISGGMAPAPAPAQAESEARQSAAAVKPANSWKEQMQAALEEANAQGNAESNRMITEYLREKEAVAATKCEQHAQQAEAALQSEPAHRPQRNPPLEGLRKLDEETLEAAASAHEPEQTPEEAAEPETINEAETIFERGHSPSPWTDSENPYLTKNRKRMQRIRAELADADDETFESADTRTPGD